MRKVLIAFALVSCAWMVGCAANVKRPSAPTDSLAIPTSATSTIYLLVKSEGRHDESKDWELFRTEWRTAMANTASAAGRRFVHLDSTPESFDQQGTLVVVDVNDYRYLSAGARYGLGVMTGNAYIDADAEFYVVPEMQRAGSRKYATSSSAWQGVFSAMTSKQVEAITDQMLKDIDSR